MDNPDQIMHHLKDPVIELSKDVYDSHYVSFLRREETSHVSVDLFFGGLEKGRPGYRIERNGFPVFLLEYVVEGEASLNLGGKAEVLRKGCLYWYGPGISCTLVNSGVKPLVKYFFAFHCVGGTLREVYGLNRLFVGANRGGERVHELVRMLFEEARVAHADSWRICCSYLDIILLQCVRSEALERHTRDRAFHVFRDVKETIAANYLEYWRMQDIATATGLDASYISRLFKRYYHMTPYEFLQQRKMDHALDLLRQKNVSVQQAAHLTGFEDPFHFSRLFKKYKGISPSEVIP